MRCRISDDEEHALYWLGRHCSTDTTWRLVLQHVWIRDGWAHASDAFHALTVPVDLPDGYVHRHDALTAGRTVNVRATLPDEAGPPPDLSTVRARRDNEAVLTNRHIDVLRPWTRRRMKNDAATLAWFRHPHVTGCGPRFVMPDGTDHRLDGNADLCCAIQAPLLARTGVALADLLGGPIRVTGGHTGPLAIESIHGDHSFLDGHGFVMPVRTSEVSLPQLERVAS